jgi:leucyl aminopeptidase
MQFKFKHSTIKFNVKPKVQSGFNILFTFAENAEENFKDLNGNSVELLIDDLSAAGSLAVNGSNLLVSLGSSNKYSLAVLSNVASSLAKFIAPCKIPVINIHLNQLNTEKINTDLETAAEKFLVDFVNGLYYFDDFKSTKSKLELKTLNLIAEAKLNKVLANAIAILDGYFIVRDLANNPSNVATPTYLGETAKGFEKISKHVSADVLDEKEIKKLGMHAFLGVAKGSKEEPRFIKLEYKGAKKDQKPIILVGKGITFDSGGISLKPGANMDDMKYDMCGAATVLGVFAAVVKLELKVNLIVLVPTCENMPSSKAQKPGDIVTSMAGKTIEILNTDAEGRLILCDALHYAKQFNPEWVVDVATLTGACVVALGSVASGLYVNDEELHSAIQDASVLASDKVWRMPLFDEYNALIKGNHADLLNIGGWGGKAGSVTAACFLQEFTDYKWAHLDVAGTASTAEAKGSTGRPFKLLVELVRAHANKG